MSIFRKFTIFATLLRRWYWVLAVGMTLLVWGGLALAMRPLPDANGQFASYPYGLVSNLEQSALDVLFQLRDVVRPETRERGLREPITIIGVDEDAIRQSGVRLQGWPRSYYARLIERAQQGGASIIGLDVYLSEESGLSEEQKADDQKLVDVLNESNVVIVQKLDEGGTPAIKPLPMFADVSSAVGYADQPLDKDRFVRTAQVFRSHPDGSADFSFASTIAQIYLDKPMEVVPGADVVRIGERVVPLRNDTNINIDFRRRSPGFRYISAGDILFNEGANVPDELFKDRIVLIGATNNDAPDLFSTPYYQPGVISSLLARVTGRPLETAPKLMPGVEIHANVAATLLFGNNLRRLSYAASLTILLLVVMLTSMAVFRLRAFLGTVVVVLIAVGFVVLSSWAFNSQGLILPLATTEMGLGIFTLSGFLLRYAHERAVREEKEAERAQIMDIFSRCVSPEVADTLWQQRADLALGGERRIVTLIFTDIRGFTTLSESVDSKIVVTWLNEYFSRMHRIVCSYGGHINKFIGDGLMIVFGAPVARGDKLEARAAVACGLEMLAEVERINEEWKGTGRPHIAIGVGIHTGEATCGVVGAEGRLEYTIIGDTVNLSARLESTTKEKGVPILISHVTAGLLGIDYETRPLGDVKVKGKSQSTEVFTVQKADRRPAATTAELPAVAKIG
ncbi:MAG: adenylate/guanylate cyclase domain-containing protein [Pyrinomonadaceae bacterium]|nr:adenylate/guanylate cyclase domain-containing protein [Pyrinomonadaceae bacterium]